MRFRGLIFASSVLLMTSLAAHADSLTFSYVGVDVAGTPATSTGKGSFSYVGSPSSLSLANLSSFSFSQTTLFPPNASSTFTYNLATLASFSATLNGDDLLTLMLTTLPVRGSYPGLAFETFTVTSLAAGGAYTTNSSSNGTLQLGEVTQTGLIAATPEPSSFLLLGTAVLGVFGFARLRLVSLF